MIIGQTIISARLYFSNYHRSAMRDIYPRWAQTFDLNYSFAPFDKDIYGSSMITEDFFYFPGIFPNNGIKIRFEKEKQPPNISMVTGFLIPADIKISIPKSFNLYQLIMLCLLHTPI